MARVKLAWGSLLQSRIRVLTLVEVSNSESVQLLLRFRHGMERLEELSIPS
jgi:hypothetical protein